MAVRPMEMQDIKTEELYSNNQAGDSNRRRVPQVRSKYTDRNNRDLNLHPVNYVSKDEPRFRSYRRQVHSEVNGKEDTEIKPNKSPDFEGMSMFPSHSQVLRFWLDDVSEPRSWENWLIVVLVAITMGIVVFSMKALTEHFQIFSWSIVKAQLLEGNIFHTWCAYAGMSCLFACISTILVVCIEPCAAGSGLPEIICVLNGVVIPKVLTMKTLIVKFFSCMLTVLSALPVGFEGPMIHIGTMVASRMTRPCATAQKTVQKVKKANGLGTYDIETWQLKGCCASNPLHYRSPHERNSLLCAGAAAGVSAAFSAPISGLMFAMEEVSTHWSDSLTWQTFICSIVARSVVEISNSIYENVASSRMQFTGQAVLFEMTESSLFEVQDLLRLNLAILLPTCLLGVIGGIMGALYVHFYCFFFKLREKVLHLVGNGKLFDFATIVETILVTLICSLTIGGTMSLQDCKYANYTQTLGRGEKSVFIHLREFKCGKNITVSINNDWTSVTQTGFYHEAATLMLGPWDELIRSLYSINTYNDHHIRLFDIRILVMVLFFFFVFSIWCSLLRMSSGLLIPQLVIGALYGRIAGSCLNFMFSHAMEDEDDFKWDWLDPGVYAMLGSASFLAATSRLPITSVIILMETTGELSITFLVMIVVMLSKSIGDMLSDPMYHAIIKLKKYPYLSHELDIQVMGKRLSPELLMAHDVMACPVECFPSKVSIFDLAQTMLGSHHGAFPVVKARGSLLNCVIGLITRNEVLSLLTQTESFDDMYPYYLRKQRRLLVAYPQFSSIAKEDMERHTGILKSFVQDPTYKSVIVNLESYVNTSVFKVNRNFSLYRIYKTFLAMGLRHVVVINDKNQLKGIITRKDLLGENIRNQAIKVINKHVARNSFRRQRREFSDSEYDYYSETDDIHQRGVRSNGISGTSGSEFI